MLIRLWSSRWPLYTRYLTLLRTPLRRLSLEACLRASPLLRSGRLSGKRDSVGGLLLVCQLWWLRQRAVHLLKRNLLTELLRRPTRVIDRRSSCCRHLDRRDRRRPFAVI